MLHVHACVICLGPTWPCTIYRSVDVVNTTSTPSQGDHCDICHIERAEALGVQERGGNGNNQYQSGNVVNTTIAPSQEEQADALGVRTRADNQHVSNDISTPSQEEHADAIGVSRPTIARWEKDRKQIMSDEHFGKWCSLNFQNLREHVSSVNGVPSTFQT